MVPVGYKPHGAARTDPETPITDPKERDNKVVTHPGGAYMLTIASSILASQ